MMASAPVAAPSANRVQNVRRIDLRWRTRFARLVRRYGVAQMAHDLEVTPTVIYQWVRGNVSPRPDKAITIIALVRPLGRLRLEDIYMQRHARLYADQNAD